MVKKEQLHWHKTRGVGTQTFVIDSNTEVCHHL